MSSSTNTAQAHNFNNLHQFKVTMTPHGKMVTKRSFFLALGAVFCVFGTGRSDAATLIVPPFDDPNNQVMIYWAPHQDMAKRKYLERVQNAFCKGPNKSCISIHEHNLLVVRSGTIPIAGRVRFSDPDTGEDAYYFRKTDLSPLARIVSSAMERLPRPNHGRIIFFLHTHGKNGSFLASQTRALPYEKILRTLFGAVYSDPEKTPVLSLFISACYSSSIVSTVIDLAKSKDGHGRFGGGQFRYPIEVFASADHDKTSFRGVMIDTLFDINRKTVGFLGHISHRQVQYETFVRMFCALCSINSHNYFNTFSDFEPQPSMTDLVHWFLKTKPTIRQRVYERIQIRKTEFSDVHTQMLLSAAKRKRKAATKLPILEILAEMRPNESQVVRLIRPYLQHRDISVRNRAFKLLEKMSTDALLGDPKLPKTLIQLSYEKQTDKKRRTKHQKPSEPMNTGLDVASMLHRIGPAFSSSVLAELPKKTRNDFKFMLGILQLLGPHASKRTPQLLRFFESTLLSAENDLSIEVARTLAFIATKDYPEAIPMLQKGLALPIPDEIHLFWYYANSHGLNADCALGLAKMGAFSENTLKRAVSVLKQAPRKIGLIRALETIAMSSGPLKQSIVKAIRPYLRDSNDLTRSQAVVSLWHLGVRSPEVLRTLSGFLDRHSPLPTAGKQIQTLVRQNINEVFLYPILISPLLRSRAKAVWAVLQPFFQPTQTQRIEPAFIYYNFETIVMSLAGLKKREIETEVLGHWITAWNLFTNGETEKTLLLWKKHHNSRNVRRTATVLFKKTQNQSPNDAPTPPSDGIHPKSYLSYCSATFGLPKNAAVQHNQFLKDDSKSGISPQSLVSGFGLTRLEHAYLLELRHVFGGFLTKTKPCN